MAPDPKTYDPTGPFLVPDSWSREDRDTWLERSVVVGAHALVARGLRAPEGMSTWNLGKWALSGAQAAGYRADPDDNRVEQFQPVIYTADHGGDCEDLGALARARAFLAGIPSRFVRLDYPNQPADHMTDAFWIDRAWRWAEASIRGAELGEYPPVAASRLGSAALPDGSNRPTGFILPGPFDDWLILSMLRKPKPRLPPTPLSGTWSEEKEER